MDLFVTLKKTNSSNQSESRLIKAEIHLDPMQSRSHPFFVAGILEIPREEETQVDV